MKYLAYLCIGVVASMSQLMAEVQLRGRVTLDSLHGRGVAGIRVEAEGAEPIVTSINGEFVLLFPRLQAGDRVRLHVAAGDLTVVNFSRLTARSSPDADEEVVCIVVCAPENREDAMSHYLTERLHGVLVANLKRRWEMQDGLADNLNEGALREFVSGYQVGANYVSRIATILATPLHDRWSSQQCDALNELLDGDPDSVRGTLGTPAVDPDRAYGLSWIDPLLISLAEILRSDVESAAAELVNATVLLPDQAECYHAQGLLALETEESDLAAEAFAAARRIADSGGRRALVARIEFLQAQVVARQGNTELAQELFQTSLDKYLELAKAGPARYAPLIVAVLAAQAALEVDQESPTAEAMVLEREIDRLAEIVAIHPGLRLELAKAIEALAETWWEYGRFRDALASFEKAESVLENSPADSSRHSMAKRTLRMELTMRIGALHYERNRMVEAASAWNGAVNWSRQLAAEDDEKSDKLADALTQLGRAQLGAGQLTLARECFDEAFEIWRRLLENDPRYYKPSYASSLIALGNFQRQTGERLEAEQSMMESLGLFRELAEVSPLQYSDSLGHVLVNLGLDWAETDRPDEAEEALIEAIDRLRFYSFLDAKRYANALGAGFNNLGFLLLRQDRKSEARELYEGVIQWQRVMARYDPERFMPILADLITNLAVLDTGQNRLAEAEAGHREALMIRRFLADRHPGRYRYRVAESLGALGTLRSDQDRLDEAESNLAEAVKIMQELVETDARAYEGGLAAELHDFAYTLSAKGEEEAAKEHYLAALAIRRRLREQDPARHESEMFVTLGNLAAVAIDLGLHDEALAWAQEAVDGFRQLAARNPDAHRAKLADRLVGLGNVYLNGFQPTAAVEVYSEALSLRRSEPNPDAASKNRIAQILDNLGRAKWRSNEPAAALADLRESVALSRELHAVSPLRQASKLAHSLDGVGEVLLSLDQYAEARVVLAEAVEILRPAYAVNPGNYGKDMGRFLGELSATQLRTGEPQLAIETATEAIQVLVQYMDFRSLETCPEIAHVWESVAIAHTRADDPEAAEAALRNSIRHYTALAEQTPSVYLERLIAVWHKLGIGHLDTDSFAAELAFRKALELFEQQQKLGLAIEYGDMARVLVNNGFAAWDRDDVEAVVNSFGAALQLFLELEAGDPEEHRHSVAEVSFNLGMLLADEHEFVPAAELLALSLSRYQAMVDGGREDQLGNVKKAKTHLARVERMRDDR